MQKGGRDLPRIPPGAFGAREMFPVNWNEAVTGDVPISVYRRQKLRRALDCLPAGVIMPPALSTPVGGDAPPNAAAGQ